jgi:prealbumin domain-containing protein
MKSRTRKNGLLGALAGLALIVALTIPAVSFADAPSGCDFASNGTTPDCQTALAPSTFAGGDGNLATSPTTYGTTDWQNVAGLNKGIDLASGTSDNSFGQGTKEDDPAVTVVTGSIPPNKSDLTRFYESSETIGTDTFLYLAWERSNVLGNANMDFEINQQTTGGFTGSTTGKITLNRQPGDLLVTYDFTNGGGRPVLGLLRWITGATTPTVTGFTTNTCFSANSFPCWGDKLTLNGTDSIGAVNNLDAVTDPIGPGAPRVMPALTFGETAINLTDAGVFQPGVCSAFGSAFLKSRASSSFTAEVKDFVAPVPVNISNCGEVKIIKNTDPRGIDQNFSYSSTLAGTNIDCSSDVTPAAFTLNDGSATTNTEDCKKVPVGDYTVTEGAEPANFALESLTCTATGSGATGAQDGTDPMTANIHVTANSVVTCTYVNKQQLGAIKITKTSSKAAATPLNGATFSITGPGSYSNSVTTANDGTACVENLPFGDYTVTETAAPSGYSIDDTSGVTVTVDTTGGCGSGNEATHTFTDTPLTDVTVTATSEATGGTQSKISCVDSGSNDVGNSGSTFTDPAEADANGLVPGTYTCTVVIDP